MLTRDYRKWDNKVKRREGSNTGRQVDGNVKIKYKIEMKVKKSQSKLVVHSRYVYLIWFGYELDEKLGSDEGMR